MKLAKSTMGLALLLIGALAAPAMAVTIDVCATAATDARFDSTGTFFTAAAPIYPGGTIAQSNTAVDCSQITAAKIGTFFTNGAFVNGLPAADPKDLALVTWHFRVGNQAFDTVGPVQGAATGGATPGQTYPQTVIGSSMRNPVSGVATVKVLDPTGFVFEIKTP